MGRDLFDSDIEDIEDDYLDGLDDEESELQSDEELGIDYHEIRPIAESQSRNEIYPEDDALVSPDAEVYSTMMSGTSPAHREIIQSTEVSRAEIKHARHASQRAKHKATHKALIKLAHKLTLQDNKLSKKTARKLQRHIDKHKKHKHVKHLGII